MLIPFSSKFKTVNIFVLILAVITTNHLSSDDSDNGSPIPFEVRPLPPELLATIEVTNRHDSEPSTSSTNPSRTTEVDAQNTEEQNASQKRASKRGSQCKREKNDTKKRRSL